MSDRWSLFLIALPLLAYVVYAIGETSTRPSLTPLNRVCWCIFLLALPVVSLIAYVILRPPPSRRRSVGRPGIGGRPTAIVELTEKRQRGELTDGQYRIGMESLLAAITE